MEVQTIIEKNQMTRVEKPTSRPQRIVRYFPDIHMRNGHKGLGDIARQENIFVENLAPGQYVVFVNTAQTALKMFAPGGVVAHLKMPGNTKLHPAVIARLPLHFNGAKINYDQALRDILMKEFKVKKE